jgi:DNA-binding XRE family transcriptional regulator
MHMNMPDSRFEWNASTIKALRTHLGRSQSALAEDLGVRQQTVSEWETGVYKPRGASSTLLTLLARNCGFTGPAPFRQPSTVEPPRPLGHVRPVAPQQPYEPARRAAGASPTPSPRRVRGTAPFRGATFGPRMRPNAPI